MAEMNVSVNLTTCFKKAQTTDSANASFTSKVPTVTEPTGDGIINCRDGGGVEWPVWLTVVPYGDGADEDAFSIRIIGWRRIGSVGAPGSYLWVPATLCECACTEGTAVGVAGAPVTNSFRFCDTITIVTEPTTTAVTTRNGTVELFSPGDNTVGYFRVKLCGVEKIEFNWDQTTNTPNMNALIAFF